MIRQRHRYFLLIIMVVIVLGSARLAAATGRIALLGVVNYSGATKAGTINLEKRLSDLVVNNFNKQNPDSFWSLETSLKKVAACGLGDFTEVITFCTDQDFARIGQKLGVSQVAFLEIMGYSEIKRQGQSKVYQLQACLSVLDCLGGGRRELVVECRDDSAGKVLESTARDLCLKYHEQPVDGNINDIRNDNSPVIANLTSKQYHLVNCHHLPAAGNSQNYDTRKDAEADGFLPCRICYPGYVSGSVFDRSIEDRLGRIACGEIEYYYRLGNDPAVTARLEKVAAPLIADTARYHVTYRFRYLDDPSINAFSAPNGNIYVTRGLLEIIESDDELAFVLAHEMAHIERKHVVVNYKTALVVAVFAAIFVANSDSSEDAIMVSVVVDMIMKGFSREQENEADETAVSHLKHAGYDWYSYRVLFGRLIDMRARKVYAIEQLFGTHPKPENRTANLDEMIVLYQNFLGKLEGA